MKPLSGASSHTASTMNVMGARRRNKAVNAVVIGDEVLCCSLLSMVHVHELELQANSCHARWHAHNMHACGVGAQALACAQSQGVGKTSLITAAATESFPDFPPPVLPPTRLPAEATPEGVPMIITDTSSREEEKTSLDVSGC